MTFGQNLERIARTTVIKIQIMGRNQQVVIYATLLLDRLSGVRQTWRREVKSDKPQAIYGVVIIVIISLLFWVAALFFGYMGDDWSSPPADERSFPAPKTY
jgi:hypothetical protein